MMQEEKTFLCQFCSARVTCQETGNRTICKPCQHEHTRHPQMETVHGFLADEKLVPILNILNEFHMRTTNSCQSNQVHPTTGEEQVWIQFTPVGYNLLCMLLGAHRTSRRYMQKWEIKDDNLVSIRFPATDLPGLYELICKSIKARNELFNKLGFK